MFTRKEDPYYIKYYLFGMRVWKRQRTSKEVVEYIMTEMGKNCANMQSILRKNAKNILTYVDAHYQAKKATPKKRK